MPLIGSDRRLIHLTGGDGRLVRLTGGDRLAPPVNNASGAGALPRLTSSGSAAALGRASGGGALARLGGSGSAMVRLTASGAGALPRVAASGAAEANFDPSGLGVVTAWLRNDTVGAVSSVTDVLNSNPAVEGGAVQPIGNADSSVTFPTQSSLLWPITAANFNVDTWAIVLWVRSPLNTATRTFYRIRNITNGASAESLALQLSGSEAISCDVYHDPVTIRRAVTPISLIGDDTPHMVTIEWNKNGATEADKFVISVDAVVRSLAFVNAAGAPGGMPPQLVSATGNAMIAANNPAGSSLPLAGRLSKNVSIIATAPMPGVTSGIFTQLAREQLFAFEALT